MAVAAVVHSSQATAVRAGYAVSAKAGGAGTVNILAPIQVLVAALLTAAQHLRVFTSRGATGDRATRAVTLPTDANAPAGLEYSFETYGTEGLRIVANTGQRIILGDQLSAAGGYVETLAANQWLTLYKLTTNVWTAKAYTTGWQVSE